jgi:hypothetical protein
LMSCTPAYIVLYRGWIFSYSGGEVVDSFVVLACAERIVSPLCVIHGGVAICVGVIVVERKFRVCIVRREERGECVTIAVAARRLQRLCAERRSWKVTSCRLPSQIRGPNNARPKLTWFELAPALTSSLLLTVHLTFVSCMSSRNKAALLI